MCLLGIFAGKSRVNDSSGGTAERDLRLGGSLNLRGSFEALQTHVEKWM